MVLTDFGISKAVRTSTELTGSGAILGTPHYMAPEQARGHEVDGRTDQYALAIVGHRVLTGKAPFDGDAQAILYQQVFESAPSLLDRRPDTPSDIRRALDRALAKEAKSRFATMEEFAAAISGDRTGSHHSSQRTCCHTAWCRHAVGSRPRRRHFRGSRNRGRHGADRVVCSSHSSGAHRAEISRQGSGRCRPGATAHERTCSDPAPRDPVLCRGRRRRGKRVQRRSERCVMRA